MDSRDEPMESEANVTEEPNTQVVTEPTSQPNHTSVQDAPPTQQGIPGETIHQGAIQPSSRDDLVTQALPHQMSPKEEEVASQTPSQELSQHQPQQMFSQNFAPLWQIQQQMNHQSMLNLFQSFASSLMAIPGVSTSQGSMPQAQGEAMGTQASSGGLNTKENGDPLNGISGAGPKKPVMLPKVSIDNSSDSEPEPTNYFPILPSDFAKVGEGAGVVRARPTVDEESSDSDGGEALDGGDEDIEGIDEENDGGDGDEKGHDDDGNEWETYQTTCAVCFEDLPEICAAAACNHVLCEGCLLHEQETTKRCPVCRKQFRMYHPVLF